MWMNELSLLRDGIAMNLGEVGRDAVASPSEAPRVASTELQYMQSNSQSRVQHRQAAVMLAGALWIACDGESTSKLRSEASVPAAPESPAAASGAPDAEVIDAEESSSLRPIESSGAGRSSSAPASVDAGIPEADAPGAALADAGGLPPSNDCCTDSALPGCSNVPVLECVCAGDAACCNESYDELCVIEAITRCDLACEVPPPASDCTTPSEVPSCTVPDVAECVCGIDPFCCTFRFDENCVVLAAAECIGAQPPGEGPQP
jgi:hypothetical protein